MARIKKAAEIVIMREAGRRLAKVLYRVAEEVKPGVTAFDLDGLAESLIREGGDKPAFKDYKPGGATIRFPATLCISINDEIVHGIPTDRELSEGDIVGLDLGLVHEGMYADMAVTVGVGTISPEKKKLIETTRDALHAGIEAARGGRRIGDIGAAIQEYADARGYGIVQELGGHGVGHALHERPYIPNYGKPGTGESLEPGMILAIEPMFNLGNPDIVLAEDDFTYRTKDGSASAHFEHTILITTTGPEILTKG